MLSDLPSFRLPVPHLEQDNVVTTICLIYGIPTTQKNVEKVYVSGMGEPVQAIKVINEK
jgi:hypothetical protein